MEILIIGGLLSLALHYLSRTYVKVNFNKLEDKDVYLSHYSMF